MGEGTRRLYLSAGQRLPRPPDDLPPRPACYHVDVEILCLVSGIKGPLPLKAIPRWLKFLLLEKAFTDLDKSCTDFEDKVTVSGFPSNSFISLATLLTCLLNRVVADQGCRLSVYKKDGSHLVFLRTA